jgi:hypothetical protein
MNATLHYNKTDRVFEREMVEERLNFAWIKYYFCHRADKKIHKNDILGGTSGKRQPIQKEAKKNLCPAGLHVSWHARDTSKVLINHIGNYNYSERGILIRCDIGAKQVELSGFERLIWRIVNR